MPKGTMKGHHVYNSDLYYFSIRCKADVKRLLKYIKPSLYHKRLKALLIKSALSDQSKPVYWKDFKPMYAEVNAIRKEMLTESKNSAKALRVKWNSLREQLNLGKIDYKQYEEGRTELEAEAWRVLEGLKAKYDEKFSDLERRIKACFRARKLSKPPKTSSPLSVSITEIG